MPKYSLRQLQNVLSSPSNIPIAIKKILIDINRRWYQHRYGFQNTDFMAEDWDNLFLLDAAHPELLRQYVDCIDYRSEFSTALSPASYSGGFIESTFNGREFHDTVYITANPHAADLDDGVFHSVWHLYNDDKIWDDKAKTILPKDVASKGIQAYENFPDKRLIVHFMQPHFPFLGPTGEEIDAGIGRTVGGRTAPHPWKEQMWGNKQSRDTLVQAYRENHELVMKYVEALLDEIEGKTVVTADHSNLIGERGFPIPIRLYGHPKEFPHPSLYTVPYIELTDTRRDVITEPPQKPEEVANEVVQDRLESLGYTQS